MSIPDFDQVRALHAALSRVTPLSDDDSRGVTLVQAMDMLERADPTRSREAFLAAVSRCNTIAEILKALGKKPEDDVERPHPLIGRDFPTGRSASDTSTTPGVPISRGPRNSFGGNRQFRPTEERATRGL